MPCHNDGRAKALPQYTKASFSWLKTRRTFFESTSVDFYVLRQDFSPPDRPVQLRGSLVGRGIDILLGLLRFQVPLAGIGEAV